MSILHSLFAVEGKCIRALRGVLCLAFLLIGSLPAAAATREEQIAAVKAQMNDAIFEVQDIVNQPVTQLKRKPGMDVASYGPNGWFHPGAQKPDFNTVDIRKTQQFPYADHKYVTSDVNPGMAFLGSELEFNPMTKYFFTDRSLPKKKLTEAEMLKINDLYRVIGKCEQQLDDLQHPKPIWSQVHGYLFTHKPVAIAGIAALLLGFIVLRKSRARTG